MLERRFTNNGAWINVYLRGMAFANLNLNLDMREGYAEFQTFVF